MPQAYTDITRLIPHRPPMVMIDQFTKHSDTAGTARKQFCRDDYGCADGQVIQGVLIECVAQTVAAQHGYDRLGRTGASPATGMLVAIDQFDFFLPVPDDAAIFINVDQVDEIGPFHLIQGEIFHGGALAARGKIKIFNQETDHGSK